MTSFIMHTQLRAKEVTISEQIRETILDNSKTSEVLNFTKKVSKQQPNWKNRQSGMARSLKKITRKQKRRRDSLIDLLLRSLKPHALLSSGHLNVCSNV